MNSPTRIHKKYGHHLNILFKKKKKSSAYPSGASLLFYLWVCIFLSCELLFIFLPFFLFFFHGIDRLFSIYDFEYFFGIFRISFNNMRVLFHTRALTNLVTVEHI